MSRVKTADRCPGVLRPHLAQDGAVVRLRSPGGQTTATALSTLSSLAEAYGNPDLQLTSRAGLQLRGLPQPVPDRLVDGVAAAGFLPSTTHERVRNITASPLTGILGGLADVRGLVVDLDRALMAEPALADLPGRFLFVVDDGRGDVASLAFDLGFRAVDAESGVVLVGGTSHGLRVTAADAVPVLIDLARQFLRVRRASGSWHVRELPRWVGGLPCVVEVDLGSGTTEAPLGVAGTAASVQVPLAMLTPRQVAAVCTATTGTVVITPWRGLVLPGAAKHLDLLTDAGLITDAASAWSMISACVGAPSCGKAFGDTRTQAIELVLSGQVRTRTHLSGCGRRCGAPASAHVDLVLSATS
jgi:precorrin-3B synthase